MPEELLDIGVETSLLAEIKDIRDELNILAVVLDSQTMILAEFENHMIEDMKAAVAAASAGHVSPWNANTSRRKWRRDDQRHTIATSIQLAAT